jgi:hypothetical protein
LPRLRHPSNVIMIPLMPRAAAGCDDLEQPSRQTQARDAATVEIIKQSRSAFFAGVTAMTQIVRVAHWWKAYATVFITVSRMCRAVFASGAAGAGEN